MRFRNVCLGLLLILVSACPPGPERRNTDYWAEGDKVYFESYSKHGPDGRQVEGADPATIRDLALNGYGADKNRVYYRGRVLEGSDPKTFRVLNYQHYISQDADHYYMGSDLVTDDRKNWEELDEYWARDSQHVYVFYHRVEGAQAKTFELLGSDYGKDAQAVFHREGRVEGADVESFVVLAPRGDYPETSTEDVAKDKHRVYHNEMELKGVDLQTFERFGRFAKDKNAVFYIPYSHSGDAWPVKAADAATFEDMGSSYGRDKDQVFRGAEVLEGADRDSFEIFDDGSRWVTRDKFREY